MTAKFPTFSPADSALLLIDHQTGTMQLIKTIPLGGQLLGILFGEILPKIG